MSTVPVTVVIATYEEGAALAATVASVLAARPSPAEVLIVDDGSTDGSVDRSTDCNVDCSADCGLDCSTDCGTDCSTDCGTDCSTDRGTDRGAARTWPPAVRVLRREHEGIAPARNAGALAATQPLLVFLDAHCEVEPGWLAPLLAAIERQPEAIAGPSMHDQREPRRAGCGARLVDPLFTYQWCRPADDAVHAVGIVPGGCLAVRRAQLLAAGGFGPFREFGLEDVDLSLRWWRAGWPVLGVPRAHVTHRFRATAPYRPAHQAWLENVLTTALRHLAGARLAETVRCCTRMAAFNGAIVAALARLPPGMSIDGRAFDDYLRDWAPQAWLAAGEEGATVWRAA